MCPWSKLGVFFSITPHLIILFFFPVGVWMIHVLVCVCMWGSLDVILTHCCCVRQVSSWALESLFLPLCCRGTEISDACYCTRLCVSSRDSISGPRTCTASTCPTDPHSSLYAVFLLFWNSGSWTCSIFRQPKFCLYFESFFPCHTNRHLCIIPNKHPVVKKHVFKADEDFLSDSETVSQCDPVSNP